MEMLVFNTAGRFRNLIQYVNNLCLEVSKAWWHLLTQ